MKVRRLLTALLVIVLTLAVSVTAMAESAVANSEAIVRTAPDPMAGVVGYLSTGDYVTVNYAQGSWTNIAFNNGSGFVLSSQLSQGTVPVIPVIPSNPVPVIPADPVPVIPQPVPVIPADPVPVIQSIPVPVITTTNAATKYATTNLNVRSGPGTGYSKIGVLRKNEAVCVLGKTGSWYQVNFHGNIGYASAKYVADSPVVVTGYPTAINGYMVTNSITTVYNGCNTQCGEVGAFPAGYRVQVVGCLGSWYKVVFGNTYGFVPAVYLSKIGY